MKRSKWLAILSIFMVLCLTIQPVSAAGRGNSAGRGGKQNQNVEVRKENNKKDKRQETNETQNEGSTSESTSSEEAVMTLVEDDTTVENGEMLRATTYALMTADETGEDSSTDDTATASSTTVKYFPVTMYDYNASTINAATDALDADRTVREGIYFNDGSPDYTKTETTDLSAFVAGEYYIQNIRASENDVGSWIYSVTDDTSIRGTANKEDATVWTLVIEDGNYYLMSGDQYLVVGTDGNTDGLTDIKTAITISAFSGNANGVQLSQNGYYLCQWGSSDSLYYGGYNVKNDGGNGMLFYPVDSDTPITPVTESVITEGYEAWNRWDKASGNNANGDLFYTGLVSNTLVDNQIEFNVNEGGIFDDNTDVKTIYEYVGLPFVLDDNGFYTFDSDVNGVYFADTDGDGTANPQSGTKDQAYNLHFDQGNPQPLTINVGDGSTNAWFPYNIYNSESTKYTQSINYHFGMRADLPFSMTPNGRIKSTDDESTPITFSFSGDDDVWVYIDGKLVIDLGGIHNRLDVTIDFAANTVTYSEENNADGNKTTGSYNDPVFATTQKLFTDDEGIGLIHMTRDAFAATEDHELSVFYLERGEGTSNCKIQFNLPMMDSVIVTKDATKSWSETNKDDADEGVDNLTAAEQAIINQIDFGFTIYKKSTDGDGFETVANTNFYLLDASGNVLTIRSTDANGHFYLKNGQSAKFITEIPSEGVTYYVVEDTVPEGFITPDFNYDGEAANGYSYLDSAAENAEAKKVAKGSDIPEQEIDVDATVNKSYEVTVYGSIEANDSVEFICSNFLNAELPNPTALTIEDVIVIDYGLPVQIDVLANDVFRGDSVEIVYVGGDDVTLTETTGDDDIVQATWTKDNEYDFGTVTLNDVTYSMSENEDGTTTVTRDTLTYKLNEQLTEVEVLSYIIKVTGTKTQEATGEELTQYDYEIGKIYIVPATTMYYEENFSNLVTFTGNGWNEEVLKNDKYVSEYQEPGVVGTVDDSTYGSDVAYLSDSEDSNGTSYYGDTTDGAIKFTYTFTGTGTSIFARTNAETGYMQVKLYKGTDTTNSANRIDLTYRDTYYCDTNDSTEDSTGTLYNVPVYTESDLHYGTYTVVATIAKAGTAAAGGENGSGNKFYLDGIRIMEPLNEDGDEVLTEKALGAYATDGEANMEVVTLRKKMITDAELNTTPWNFVVMTDTNGEIVTLEDYISIGPKEEVYLEKGQTVSFSLKYWQTDGLMLYMGMKAPFGSGTVKVGQTTYDLKNAADCYYDITKNYSSLVTKYEQATTEDDCPLYTDAAGKQVYEDLQGDFKYVSDDSLVAEDAVLTPVDDTTQPYYLATFTLTATDKIVSLTNIKVTGNYEFSIVDDTNIDINGDDSDGDIGGDDLAGDSDENGGE